MSKSNDRALELAKRLLDENRRGRSWRCIAREDYGNKINFATLNRIAIHAGEWVPHDKKILQMLGLAIERKKADEHTKAVRRKINRMARETRKALKVEGR